MAYTKRKEDWVNTTDYIDQSDVDAWEQAIYELKTAKVDPRDYAEGAITSEHLQGALDELDANSDLGVIEVPSGTYDVGDGVTIPFGSSITLRGAGRERTTLQWTDDLGAGEYAIGVPDGFPGSERFRVEDMTIEGPEAATLGVATTEMYGVRLCPGMTIQNCFIHKFHSCIVVIGDHSNIRDCLVGSSYYGIYFKNGNPDSVGNHTFDTITMNCEFACMACEQGTTIAGASFNQLHFVDTPYGLYRETGSFPNEVWVGGVAFIGCSFESLGNGMIYDEDGTGQFTDNTFSGCGSSTAFYSGTQIGSRPADYDVRVGRWIRNFVTASSDLFAVGDAGMFQVLGTMTEFEWRWFSAGIDDLDATHVPVVGTDPVNVFWYTPQGKCIVTRTGTACNEHDLMVVDTFGTVKKATSGAPAGVALHAADAGDTVLLCVESAGFLGGVDINTTDTTIDAGEYLKQDTGNAGRVVVASGPLDGVPVGVAKAEDSGGVVRTWLRGLH